MTRFHILKATKQKITDKKIFGFDIETYDNNKKFYCSSIYGDDPAHCKTFFSKDDAIKYFKKERIFRNSIVSATNLQFDFFGLFHDKPDETKFRMLWRGSQMLYAESYFKGGEFISHAEREKNSQRHKFTFIDTGNYTPLSVKQLGNIIGLPKLKTPSFIGAVSYTHLTLPTILLV